MMNERILELIKNPKIITENDLGILETESNKMPYAQSIRAIYLYGVHLYKPDLYKENLSKTAAYTTDKKILYQFINPYQKPEIQNPKSEEIENSKSYKIIENKEIITNKSIPEETVEIVELKNEEILIENHFDSKEMIIFEKKEEIFENNEIEKPEKKSEEIGSSENEISTDINFSGIENFLPEVKFSVPKNHSDHLNPPKIKTEKLKSDVVRDQNPKSDWKPMTFSSNIDSFIEKTENQEIERKVFNVSFFENKIPKIEEKEETGSEKSKESNVGVFINTWQNWLKIERPLQSDNLLKTKEKIIDNFIENNPKISQLKEDGSYVVKEKKSDISHLMTETLAKLYTEQKLYSKAVKAYETLIEKYPEKADYFRGKIQNIKT